MGAMKTLSLLSVLWTGPFPLCQSGIFTRTRLWYVRLGISSELWSERPSQPRFQDTIG